MHIVMMYDRDFRLRCPFFANRDSTPGRLAFSRSTGVSRSIRSLLMRVAMWSPNFSAQYMIPRSIYESPLSIPTA